MTALVNLRTLLLNDICLELLPINMGRLVTWPRYIGVNLV